MSRLSILDRAFYRKGGECIARLDHCAMEPQTVQNDNHLKSQATVHMRHGSLFGCSSKRYHQAPLKTHDRAVVTCQGNHVVLIKG